MSSTFTIAIGVKTDPIEYRYSYEWLFRLLAEEGIQQVQLGSFFELYQLPDAFFEQLKHQAADYGIQIRSLFTAHRELGGFLREDPGWETLARKNYERFIEVGALLHAHSVGSNPGAILRDRMEFKSKGIGRYLRHMQELMHFAYTKGISCLTIEPMSCLAEPPTTPDEIHSMATTLADYHKAHSDTAYVGLCVDVSHGYVDKNGKLVHSHLELLECALPWLEELHIKNTDARYGATFGFSEEERARGIIDLMSIRELLYHHATRIPKKNITAYLEISGPKLGRDYSDYRLEAALRDSLNYVKEVFKPSATAPTKAYDPLSVNDNNIRPDMKIEISPSLMCADFLHLENCIQHLERLGTDWLHLDIMDAVFTRNMPIGLELLRQLKEKTSLPFDAHLMVMDHDFFIREMLSLGARQISVHVESARHLDRTLAFIRDSGVRAGVALNPATPLSVLDYVLERLDFVLIMTVNPGFAGQQIVPAGLRKVAACREYLDTHGVSVDIQVDGHVSFDTIPYMVAAGANCLVAGSSSLFHPMGSLEANMNRMKRAITEGLARRSQGNTFPMETS